MLPDCQLNFDKRRLTRILSGLCLLFASLIWILTTSPAPVVLAQSTPATTSGTISEALAQRPNIIVIMVDDLGWRDTSIYGSKSSRTPQIDSLAARGVIFTQAYSSSSLDEPSQASFLTGKWPARLKLTQSRELNPGEILEPSLPQTALSHISMVTPTSRTQLPGDELTAAEILQTAGYATAFMGKWNLGENTSQPENQGFSHFVRSSPLTSQPQLAGQHTDDLLTQQAINWMETNSKEPFFLNLWYQSVGAPFQAPPADIQQARTSADPSQDPQQAPVMAAMIAALDQRVGLIVAALERLQLTQRTIIVFTSDNGGNMTDTIEGDLLTSNRPLRGGKGSMYEGGSRVPLIIVWPGVATPARSSDDVVSAVDLLPTLVDMAHGTIPAGHQIDGVTLKPALTGATGFDRGAIFHHYPHYNPTTGTTPAISVRSENMKLIRFFGGHVTQTDRIEVYDLQNDPGERINLARSRRDEIVRMTNLIQNFLIETGALVPQKNPDFERPQQGWATGADAEVEDGELVLKRSGDRPILFETYDVPHVNRHLRLRLPLKTSSRMEGRVMWSTASEPSFTQNRQAKFAVTQTGEWETHEITLPVQDLLTGIRIEFGKGDSDLSLGWIRAELIDGNLVKEWQFGEVESE